MMGVAASPPIAPTLVMEKVPPLRSARSSVRFRAASARFWMSSAISKIVFMSAPLTTGTMSPSGTSTAMPIL